MSLTKETNHFTFYSALNTTPQNIQTSSIGVLKEKCKNSPFGLGHLAYVSGVLAMASIVHVAPSEPMTSIDQQCTSLSSYSTSSSSPKSRL